MNFTKLTAFPFVPYGNSVAGLVTLAPGQSHPFCPYGAWLAFNYCFHIVLFLRCFYNCMRPEGLRNARSCRHGCSSSRHKLSESSLSKRIRLRCISCRARSLCSVFIQELTQFFGVPLLLSISMQPRCAGIAQDLYFGEGVLYRFIGSALWISSLGRPSTLYKRLPESE